MKSPKRQDSRQLAIVWIPRPVPRAIVRHVERFDFEQRGGRMLRQWLRVCFNLGEAHGSLLMEWFARERLGGAESVVNELLGQADGRGWIRLSSRSQPTQSQRFGLYQARQKPVTTTHPRGEHADLWEPNRESVEALLFVAGINAPASEPANDDASSIDAVCILSRLPTTPSPRCKGPVRTKTKRNAQRSAA